MAEQIAELNYLKLAPRKVRAVAGIIKGLRVNEAEAQLLIERRRASQVLLKLLRSAVADAKNNQRLDPAKLFIKSIRVDQGPMLKRYLPRARGMATPIEKKMSHVTLILEESKETKTPRFTITPKKKVKLPGGDKKTKTKPGKEKSEEGAVVTEKSKRPSGFFKRAFSRKSGMGN